MGGGMRYIIAMLISSFMLSSCVSYKTLYLPDANYLKRRNIETRVFDTSDSKSLLIAAAQVLQDMGYNITESELSLGVITADKKRDAISGFEKAALHTLAFLVRTEATYENIEKFYVSIVVTDVNNSSVKLRVLFAKMSWDNHGNIHTIEEMKDTKLYKRFFDKLEQSIFLTGYEI